MTSLPRPRVHHRLRLQRLALVIAVCSMLLGLSAATTAADALQPSTTVSGRLVRVIGDPLPAAEEGQPDATDLEHAHEHRVRWGVQTADAVVWLAGQPRIEATLQHQQVTITGQLTSSGELFPTSVTLPEADAAPQEEHAPAIGLSRWVNILCRFADVPGDALSPQQMQARFGNTFPAIGNYFNDVSYGAMTLEATTAPQWVELPQPRSHYVVQDEWGTWFDQNGALIDCTAAADALVDYSQYDGINLAFNADLDGYAWGGEWSLTLDGVEREFGITWLPPFGYMEHSILAHEIGHALGLPHSSGMYGAVYDSWWDLMSGGGNCSSGQTEWGCVGVHPIAIYKHKLGWLPNERVTTIAANSSAALTLAPLSEADKPGQLLAIIPINGSTTTFFTVEARSFAGYDMSVPHEGVIIHRVTDLDTGTEPAKIVDIDLNGNPNDYGAIWQVGETFIDPGAGISVTVTGQSGTSYDIEITSNTAFARTWDRTDRPVAAGAASRTWMWGPEPLTAPMSEEYWDGFNGERTVVYWDKSRMEVTDPAADPTSVWYVTNGLLARELITGNLQLADDWFEEYTPATANVAGDQDDASGPTYATFGNLLHTPPAADGTTLTQRVARNGTISNDPALAAYGATAAHRVSVPGLDHQVASPFWAFMNSTGVVWQDGQFVSDALFIDPFYATGLPITEAYWATVRVAGAPMDVLMQCFERRCLTWTPGNPDGWQVEAGNVGAHYLAWRSVVRPDDGQ